MPEPEIDDIDESNAASLDGEQDPEKDLEQDPEKEHEPEKDSPRWKEIYWQNKEHEREIATLKEKDVQTQEDLKAIREHNKALADAVIGVEDQFSDANRPDPVDDPEKYDEWMAGRVERKIKKSAKKEDPAIESDAAVPGNDPLTMQEHAMRAVYDDYDEVIKTVGDDLKKDPILRNQIMNKPNTAKLAYQYGKKKAEVAAAQKKDADEQGNLESGGHEGGGDTPGKLSPAQKRVAKALGISEENYSKQRKAIDKKQEVEL